MSWDWLRAQTALRSLLSVARHEFLVTLRERSGWGTIVAACALAFADSALQPLTPLVSGVRASVVSGSLVLPFLAIILVAGAARRDQTTSAADVIGARPYRRHLLLLARVLSCFAVVTLTYALVIVSSVAAPMVLAGRWPSPLTPIDALAREIVPLFFVVTLTYCAVAIARNVLTAAVLAVYALFVFLWGDYLAPVFNFTLTQNAPTYGLIGLGALLGAMTWARGDDRTQGTWPGTRRLMLGLTMGLVLAGVATGWHRVATTHNRPLHMDPFATNMASQDIRTGSRAPGFWLPDQWGRDFRISSVDGRVLVLAFWSPHVAESMAALDVLRGVAREFRKADVACVAVCVADDYSISGHIAREGRYGFPMVTDTGTHFTRVIAKCSPLTEAYDLSALPTIIVTDSARRVTAQFGSGTMLPLNAVIAEARQALSVPPPPS